MDSQYNSISSQGSGCQLQLFVQPSLSNIYLRNNRSMTKFDFILQFPSISLKFGLSSDIASGWSKLIYEQSLIYKNRSVIEVDIVGLGQNEAHAVEECVKLLFGFRVTVEVNEIWLFLKVCDMIGICQSPLSPTDLCTVQEQLIQYALQNYEWINIIEAWDYIQTVTEYDGFLIRKSEIKLLVQKLIDRIKQQLQDSAFEVLCNYGFDKQVTDTKHNFSLRDLKREHYIQLRTLFYVFLRETKLELGPNQNLVKVLFDELDVNYELDGLVNRQIDIIKKQLDGVVQKFQDTKTRLLEETQQLKNNIATEQKAIKSDIFQLNRMMDLQSDIFKSMLSMQVTASTQNLEDDTIYIGTNNGLIEAINEINGSQIRTYQCEMLVQITAMTVQGKTIFAGLKTGQIYLFNYMQKAIVLQKQGLNVQVNQLLVIKNKLLLSCYNDGSIIVWDMQAANIVYDSGSQSVNVRVLYSHQNIGDFIATGNDDGSVRLCYYNQAREKPSFDLIKKFKNNQSQVTSICCVPILNDLLLVSNQDLTLNTWNWESEVLLIVIKLESQCISIQSGCFNLNAYFITLLDKGIVQLYSFESGKNPKLFQSISTGIQSISLNITQNNEQFRIIHSNGKHSMLQINTPTLSFKLLTNPSLSLYNIIQQHSSCVYSILPLHYPYFASASDDRTIRIFNLNTHESSKLLKGHQAYVRALALLQDTSRLTSASYDSSIKIWEIPTGMCINTLTGHTKPVLALQTLSHTEYLFVSAGEDSQTKCWNWKSATCIWSVDTAKNEVWALLSVKDFSTNSFGLLTGHKDGLIRVLNVGLKGDQTIIERELKPHKSFVNRMTNIQNQIIATASSDHLIVVSNWKSGITLWVLRGHQDIVWDLAMVNNNCIASSSSEGTIKLWNWRTGQCLNTTFCAKGSIYTLLKINNSNKILSGQATGEIIMWKIIKPNSDKLSSLIQ